MLVWVCSRVRSSFLHSERNKLLDITVDPANPKELKYEIALFRDAVKTCSPLSANRHPIASHQKIRDNPRNPARNP
jgi:hypothetical protein